jgi:glycosyltransferase involved in cell wall biosynthesis
MNSLKEYQVSAIVPTYNAERFMRGLLEDLEAQTIANQIEIVIVDTGSPTNEGAIVKEFQRRYENIVYIRTEKRESSHKAINRGIKAAQGKYLTLACTDDRHKKDAIERMVAVLEARPDIALVYVNSFITEVENETFENHKQKGSYRWLDFNPLQLLYGCYIGPQPMWRKSVHDRYGYFDESLESAGDWDFWLRMAETETFLHLDEYLGLYLYSPTSSEHRNPMLSYKEALLVKRRYLHRLARLLRVQKKIMIGEPVISGALVLVRRGMGGNEQLACCVEQLRCSFPDSNQFSIRVVREHREVPENRLGVKVSPSTPTIIESLQQGIDWEARYVVLLSSDVLVTRSCLDKLIAVADSEPTIAVVGPISDSAPEPQKGEKDFKGNSNNPEELSGWKEVPYLGSFCLLLKSEVMREIGGLNEKISLPIALWELYSRLRSRGFKIACAQGVYVSRSQPITKEDEKLDALQIAEESLHQAEQQFQEGCFQEAEETLRGILEDFPEHFEAHNDLACLFWQTNRMEDALKELLRSMEVVPDNRDAIWNLGQILKMMGRDSEAHKVYGSYLERHPEEEEMGETLSRWKGISQEPKNFGTRETPPISIP